MQLRGLRRQRQNIRPRERGLRDRNCEVAERILKLEFGGVGGRCFQSDHEHDIFACARKAGCDIPANSTDTSNCMSHTVWLYAKCAIDRKSSDLAMHSLRRERRHADGDVFGSVLHRSRVLNPFPFVSYDSLPSGHV